MAPLALAARTSLGPTLERLAGRGIRYLDLAVGDGPAAEPGWIAPAALLEHALLEDRLAQVAIEAELDEPRLLGTYLLEGYVHALATPALGAYLTERRVPDVGPRAVALRLGEGSELTGVAYLAPRFGVLLDDAAATGPAALPFATEAELMAWFRRRLVRHVGPLIAELVPRTRRGPRALWASVEDILSGILHWLGEALDCAEWARGQADLLLGVEAPLGGRTRWRALEHPGGIERFRERNGCCQYFRKGTEHGACFTCARTSDEERLRRLTEQE
jgi:hypothetical protein